MRRDGTAWALVVATVVLWGTAFPAIRVSLESFGPVGLSFARTGVAAIALLAGAPLAGVRRPSRDDLGQILLCAATGTAAYQLLLNAGERTVTAGTASLIIATAPVYSVLIAGRLLGEHLPARRWIGLAVALAGTSLVAVAGPEGLSISSGALIVLAAAVVQGIYHVAQRPLLRTYTGFEVATYAMVAGSLMMLPAAPFAVSDAMDASRSSLLAVVFLGIGPSAIGFVTWASAVGRLDVSRPALALYAVPAVAILVAWWWLDELPTTLAVVGGVVSIVGVVIGSRAAPTPRRSGGDGAELTARTAARG